MTRLEHYLNAADRENTRKSYTSALRHFEEEWKGFLPATPDAVARYLADYAPTLTINTLRHRLAALARWHVDQGFPDPTRTVVVRQVFKGIRALHTAPEKRARPLQLDAIQSVSDWLDRAEGEAIRQADRPRQLRLVRDRALLLLGFWRGFRADELVNLCIEHIEIVPGQGLTCYLARSKGDRAMAGRSFQCPALSRLCPVAATESWLALSGLREGPVFRKINPWGHLGEAGLATNSLIPMLRRLFTEAGVANADDYSSHSLRRGFAGWARANGWDLKDLMAYVGWKDVKSAMRYLDGPAHDLQARFEQGLPPRTPTFPTPNAPSTPIDSALNVTPMPTAIVHVQLALTPYQPGMRAVAKARRQIELRCFERNAMHRIDAAGTQYELMISFSDREALDETLYALLDDMHRIAEDHQCFLEGRIHEPATDAYWE